jgi:cell wall-associated NlpC family hydrolase
VLSGVLVAGLAAAATLAPSSAHADPLASAKTRAVALAADVSRLSTQAEVASQRYDSIEDQLQQAVSAQVSDDRSLDRVRSTAAQARQVVTERTQALYESGGESSVIASLVSGTDPTEALTRYRLADAVVRTDQAASSAASTLISRAATVEAHAANTERSVTTLQAAAGAAASRVQALLAHQRAELAAAHGTVRRLEAIAAAQAAAASEANFTAAVSAAGGHIDASGPTAAPNSTVAAAMAAARSRLGDPYVWGATGPLSFDCSGLMQWSYARAGITLPRVAAAQWGTGPHPSLSHLEPGDLLFWATNTHDPATIHHVAMYIGRGLMIAAPHTGENVQVQPVYMDGFIGATRPVTSS